jgi:glutathione S-transferase
MQPTPVRLVSLKISPWSERARWALDHHRIGYEIIEHVPFLGERRLRRIVGPGKKRVTAPVLITGDEVLSESWDIALHADRTGNGPKLMTPGRESEVREWTDLADRTMGIGRALVVGAMLASPEAIREGLPREVPGFLRSILTPVSRYGMKWFANKYDLRFQDRREQLAAMRATLGTLRAALAKSPPYLLGSFSYADIATATCLQGILPVADRYIRLGPATRKAWTQEELAAEHRDLIAWRDELYERHREPDAS